eukprot:s1700_g2.t1
MRKTCGWLIPEKTTGHTAMTFAAYHPYKNFWEWMQCRMQTGEAPGYPMELQKLAASKADTPIAFEFKYSRPGILSVLKDNRATVPVAVLLVALCAGIVMSSAWAANIRRQCCGQKLYIEANTVRSLRFGMVRLRSFFQGPSRRPERGPTLPLHARTPNNGSAWRPTQKATSSHSSRSADDLAAELEHQARRVSTLQGATELATRWVERSDSGHGAFTLGGSRDLQGALAEPLSFYQALLRSQAMESLVEACARAPILRGQLLQGDDDGEAGALRRALQALVERLLLPGSLALWPTLLEALVASASEESAERSSSGKAPRTESCAAWSRKALALVKRQWQHELIPSTLRCLDRKLAALMSAPAQDSCSSVERVEASTNADLLRSSKDGMSKGGIRAALAQGRLKKAEGEASRIRERTVLLCDAVAKLEAESASSKTNLPEVDQLLDSADQMLSALDTSELSAEQTHLRESLTELKGGLEQQMAEFRDTLSSFASKRNALEEERSSLARRLEEVQLQLSQLQESTTSCEKRSRELENQLRDTTKHFEDKIAGSFCLQRQLADEKLRAVACKACAHTARDIVSGEDDFEHRRSEELATQLRRRRLDLRRTCASYVRQERLRIEAIAGMESSRQAAKVERAWREAQEVLQRALPLCKGEDSNAQPRPTELAEQPAQPLEEPRALRTCSAAQDAAAFFAEAGPAQTCIDCKLPDADWASVSVGAYLCVDCAGRHRGLGVHLSFVRSTTMDLWSPTQLRRMQLGGSSRFRSFLEGYPKLRAEPHSAAALFARYNSKAVAYYRQLLERRSEGKSVDSWQRLKFAHVAAVGIVEEGQEHRDVSLEAGLVAPSSDEGHLPQDQRGDAMEETSAADDDEAAPGSVEEELADFEASYERHRVQDKELPRDELWQQGFRAPLKATPSELYPIRFTEIKKIETQLLDTYEKLH